MASQTQRTLPSHPEQGWLRCLEEIQEGFTEKVTSELDLER